MLSSDYFIQKASFSLKLYTKYAFEKWFRLVLKTIGPILLQSILMLLGDGPSFKIFADNDVCPTDFWKNLLFFNNFVNTPKEIVSISSL